MGELLFLEPVFKEMIWGGERLKKDFGYEIPGSHTGECWAISAHPNGDCQIKNGTYKGEKLSDLYKKQPQLFGNPSDGPFPLLVKIIDAKEDLSIQVHPDDIYAKENENGSFGKTECWYILDCDENTEIVIGHNAKNKQEVEEMIQKKRFDQFIRRVPVHKGDFFQIDPGTVHAIKGGTLILETQQNSDITYRVYDYDRLSDGKPRELHTRQSIDVIKAPFVLQESKREEVSTNGNCQVKLVSCPYYTVYHLDIKKEYKLSDKNTYCLVSVVEGKGTVDGIPVVKGDHFIIPYGSETCLLNGEMECICSYPSAI